MRWFLGLVWAVAANAAAVSGIVYLEGKTERRPVPGVRVVARAVDGSGSLGTAVTDVQGRFRLDDLPRRRIVVRSDKPGYFTRAAASRETTLVLDLSGGEDLPGADFEAAPGGVITGRLSDPWGDPLERVIVMLTRLGGPGDRHREHASQATSDDRGVYRLYGLSPGRYRLGIVPPVPEGREEHPAVMYHPVPLEVAAGQEVRGVDVVVRPDRLFQVRGRVAEPPPPESGRLRLTVRWVREEPGAPSFGLLVEPDGSFLLPRLPAGTYMIESPMGRQRLDLSSDRDDLVVRPTPPGQLAGRLLLIGITKPVTVRLEARDSTRQVAYHLVAKAPDYRFRVPQVWADTYTLRAETPKGAWVLDPPEVVVAAGETGEVEIRVGTEAGRIDGLVKGPGGAPLAHGRVALARFTANRIEVRTEQTDQKGRFEIRDVRPGEYRICAWPGQDISALDVAGTWERAGTAVRRFAVEPGVQIELELTAAR
jgi:hypothetical protein